MIPYKSKLIACLLFSLSHIIAHNTDMVVFSYNRPLQLYAFLESVRAYVKGLNSVSIIYRVDNQAYEAGYDIVKATFDDCIYIKESDNPRLYFKSLFLGVLSPLFKTADTIPYLIYSNDDIVIKDYIDLDACGALLEQHNGYGFYLRLGRNLNYCYALNRAQPLPPLREVEPGVFAWNFNKGTGDWAYPHSVDMTLVRKKEIQPHCERLPYYSPNTFEGHWATQARAIMHRTGLCYDQSKILNFPLNVVQHDFNNRHMNALSPEKLLEVFMSGKKMDIAPTFQMHNTAAHTEYIPTFIER